METAIKVLRQAGYYSHAVYLAEKHAHHEWYLKIQLEDIKVRYYCSRVLTGVNIASLTSCVGGNLISLACLHSSPVAGLFRQSVQAVPMPAVACVLAFCFWLVQWVGN